MTRHNKRCIIRVTKEIEKKGNDKMIDLQVTFFHNENKYRPISTIIKVESLEEYKKDSRKQQIRALTNIAHYRKTTPKDLVKQGFTQVKVREYNIGAPSQVVEIAEGHVCKQLHYGAECAGRYKCAAPDVEVASSDVVGENSYR